MSLAPWPSERPLILAHRGACQHAPENTLEAFTAGLEQGADGVELDVRCSSDLQPVIVHDPTLERYTSGADRRSIHDVTARQLAHLGPPHGPVPSLRSALKWATATGAYLNIELKCDFVPRTRLVCSVVEQILEARVLWPRLLLSSFDPRIVRDVRHALPEITVGWLIDAAGSVAGRLASWKRTHAPAVHLNRQLASETGLVPWQRAGALIVVWTVNDPRLARALASQGVHAIITDDVAGVLETSQHPPAT